MDRPVTRGAPRGGTGRWARGVALALALAAGAARAGDAPPRVAGIELRLPEGEPREAAAALVAVAVGEPLSIRALRLTVQRLYLTGRYRSVVIRELPAAPPQGGAGAWVRLAVEALPVRRIERIALRKVGGLPNEDAVRQALRLEVGDPFDEAALQDAVDRARALLAKRGYRDAAIETEVQGDALVSVTVEIRAGAPTRVRTLRAGSAGDPAAALAGRLRTRPGAILDQDVLAEDVRTLRSELYRAGYRRARVGAPAVTLEGGLADVELPVVVGPRVTVVFRGNERFPASALQRRLGVEEDQPLDAPAIDAAAERLRTFYRSRGFAGARVEAEEQQRGDDLAVIFHVAEGLPYRLGPVAIEGTSQWDAATVRQRLVAYLEGEEPEPSGGEDDAARALLASVPGVTPPPTPPPALGAAARWEEDSWDRAAERVVDGYRADGWLEAVYLGGGVTLDDRRRVADVTVRFREGPLTRVESISFEGNAAVSLPELAHEARLAPGEPLAFDRVEATRVAILRLYLSRGYFYARVEAREDLDRERHVAAVRFVVEEGPQVRIGQILLAGNKRTRPEVIRGALAIGEGQVYDPEAIAKSNASLLRLGVFRSVNLKLQDPESPQPVKDLEVELAEGPYATLTQGIGYSIANGPRADVEYTRPNVLGRAIEFAARGKVNYLVDVGGFGPDVSGKDFGERIEGRGDVGLRWARLDLLPFQASARADAIGEVLHRRAYDLRRRSAVAGLDVGLTSRIGASLQYELEVDDIRRTPFVGQLTQADIERLRFDEGVTTLQVLRPSFTVDFRDNAAHPHRGWFAAGALEYGHSLGSGIDRVALGLLPGSDIHTNMLKLSGTLSGYLPVGKASVVALSLRGGRVFPLDSASRTIIPRRFFLGGASTMRGFAEEEMIPEDVRGALAAAGRACATSVTGVGCTAQGSAIAAGQRAISEGGEAFLLVKSEVRLSLTPSVEAGFFVDLGNLWLDPNAFDPLALRTNVGVGLRFVTPVGPAALDFGFNVTPDRAINERVFAPHFSIGLF
jgi:outer membrane protein insertion porin family